jgi:hypothetical protein
MLKEALEVVHPNLRQTYFLWVDLKEGDYWATSMTVDGQRYGLLTRERSWGDAMAVAQRKANEMGRSVYITDGNV